MIAPTGDAGRDHVSLLRELMANITAASGIADSQDSWLLADVDETVHSGTVQLETYAPTSELYIGTLLADSDSEDSLYAVPEVKSGSGMIQVGVAVLQSRQSLAAQPMHIQLHDGSVRFGSALAWISCKQATVMVGIAALLNRHLEHATVRLPIMLQLVEVRSQTCLFECVALVLAAG